MINQSNWTGERLETFVNNDNTIEHLHRYAVSFDFVEDKVVLDIASGEGYGSNLLSNIAKKVYGVDIDIDTIYAAKEKYKKKNLEFLQGSADAIPLPSNSIDVVVSFETLEHHDKHLEMMEEIKRVLKVDGVLVISTPDKRYYSDELEHDNKFHVKELYFSEFKELVNKYFTNTIFFLQKTIKGSLLIPENKINGFNNYNGDYDSITKTNDFKQLYLLSIASDASLNNVNAFSIFDGKEVEEKLRFEIQLKSREEAIAWMKKSLSFRIGHILLSPFKFFKK